MRLDYIEMHGFRGFRTATRIDVPPGFLVVVGPNGAGKSTLCDAIEFALTGAIRGASDHKEKGESVRDYLWWRGSEVSEDGYVEVGVVSKSGERTTIRRDRKGVSMAPSGELASLFVVPGSTLEDPLRQLCRTTILRDEEITGISVDLRETERFAFVRSALGAADVSATLARLGQIEDHLKGRLAALAKDYEVERERVSSLGTRVSQAKADAARADDLAQAERTLRSIVGEQADDLAAVVSLAERTVAAERRRAQQFVDALAQLRELGRRKGEVETPDYQQRLAKLNVDEQTRSADAAQRRAVAEEANAALSGAQRDTPLLASLAQLVEHGGIVGLRDGRCPLCGTALAADDFEKHILQTRESIARQNGTIVALSKSVADAAREAARSSADAERATRERQRLGMVGAAINADIDGVSERLRGIGFQPADDLGRTIEALGTTIEELRRRSEAIENTLVVVRASQAAGQVIELEREYAAAQGRLAQADAGRARTTRALTEIHEAEQATKRLQGELVDEQLAALTPLLVELYQRLRPHIDWPEVKYTVRGDVRRMLSVEVGAGLNPSFMFSSGQRRAAGLAFLLAIHLSRSWCKLEALVLDDPVQHVDDYRALHLTEVLAAIRRNGRQVICTVEDSALAELLTRRLRSEAGQHGGLIRLGYEAGRGSYVADARDVLPFARGVLVSQAAVG